MKSYRKPYRVKKRKSIFRNRFFWLAIFILIVVGGFLYFLFLTPFFQIKGIEISGNQKVLTEDIQSRIQWVLSREGNYIFLCNSNKINQEILHFFPEIARVDTKIKFPDKLVVQIEERKPVAIFFKDEDYFFLDKEGVIFGEASSSNNTYLKIKNQTPNQSLNLGSIAIEKEILTPILEIESNLKENLKIPLREILIISEERLNIITEEGWEIYFSLERDIEKQLTELRAVLEEQIPPDKRKDLEYIDLRFSRVFYRYRQ